MKLRTNSICALVASALLASTTCNLNDHQEAAVAPSRVTSAAEVSEVYDYCQISPSSDRVDLYNSGAAVELETLFEGNINTINYWPIEYSIVPSQKRAAYEIMIIPVGFGEIRYSESTVVMNNLIDTLERAFAGVDVSFSYLSLSLPIGFQFMDRLVSFSNTEEANNLLKRINSIYPVNSLAFMLNTTEFLGTYLRYPIFSVGYYVNNENSPSVAIPYIPIHEIGHSLGLGDGYRRFYQQTELGGSELFTSPHLLYPGIMEAYISIKPPIVNTGNICNGEPIYTFYSLNNDIMDRFYDLEELTSLLEQGRSPFNPFQIEVMNNYIRNFISIKE